MLHVVVTKEDDVDALDLPGNGQSFVFAIRRSDNAALKSTVKQSHDEVGVLVVVDEFYPILAALNDVVDAQAAVDARSKPVGDGRRQHAQHSNFHAFLVQYRVGFHIGGARCSVHNVGTQHGAFHLAHPLVVHGVSWLNVVVAHRLGIIAQVIHDLRRNILLGGVHIVVVVADGLPLQNIAIVEQYKAVAQCGAQRVDIGAKSGYRACPWLAGDEVIWEKTPVHVTCLEQSDAHLAIVVIRSLSMLRRHDQCNAHGHERQYQLFLLHSCCNCFFNCAKLQKTASCTTQLCCAGGALSRWSDVLQNKLHPRLAI